MPEDVTPDDQIDRRIPSQLIRLLRWKIVLPAILLAGVIFAPVFYRQQRLAQVPDIGDPFPVSEALKPIPEEENAFPLFEEAFKLLIKVAKADSDKYWHEAYDGWDPSDNLVKKYLKLNRPAMEEWRKATEKDNFQVVPIEPDSISHIMASRELVRFCELEIDRLTKTGSLTDTSKWLRASFRCSALVTRNGPVMNRLVGTAFFANTSSSAEKWMQHPDVTSGQLLELLAVVQESARLMEKPSTTMKFEYLVLREIYDQWSYDEIKKNSRPGEKPPLSSQLEAWLFAEPEFSRRLNAHVFSNILPYVDLPRRERPPMPGGEIFEYSSTKTMDERIPPEELDFLLKEAKVFQSSSTSGFLNAFDRSQARYACLQVALAAQAFYRDRGKFPEKLADLQPNYLKSLPDDPYASKPETVIYRRTGNEAVVYSRFQNGIDDGGTTVTPEEFRGGGWPNDFGIRIRKPHYPPVFAPRPKLSAPKTKVSSGNIGKLVMLQPGRSWIPQNSAGKVSTSLVLNF